jgi:hypothetical protein
MDGDDDTDGTRPLGDVVLVGAPVDAQRWPVLRHREDRLEVGELRTVREGQPMAATGEVVKLRPRREHARLFDVEVLADLDDDAVEIDAARSGPPQVATAAYRVGWDATFGKGSN